MTRYQINPELTPLLDIEIQTLFAFYNEFGFEEEFVEFVKKRGFEWDGFVPKRTKGDI